MGMDADAKIAYGVSFDEGASMPWKQDDGDEIEEWWRKLHGYNNPHDPFDARGNWKSKDKTEQDAQWKIYSDFREAFDKTCPPCPVEISYAGADSYSTIVLFVPNTIIRTEWEAVKFDPDALIVKDKPLVAFHEFIEKYFGEEKEKEIGWLLFPYCG